MNEKRFKCKCKFRSENKIEIKNVFTMKDEVNDDGDGVNCNGKKCSTQNKRKREDEENER